MPVVNKLDWTVKSITWRALKNMIPVCHTHRFRLVGLCLLRAPQEFSHSLNGKTMVLPGIIPEQQHIQGQCLDKQTLSPEPQSQGDVDVGKTETTAPPWDDLSKTARC